MLEAALPVTTASQTRLTPALIVTIMFSCVESVSCYFHQRCFLPATSFLFGGRQLLGLPASSTFVDFVAGIVYLLGISIAGCYYPVEVVPADCAKCCATVFTKASPPKSATRSSHLRRPVSASSPKYFNAGRELKDVLPPGARNCLYHGA